MNRIPAGHEIVNSAELATLRRKAQAHDAYLWATKRMADKTRTVLSVTQAIEDRDLTGDPVRAVGYRDGYSNALTDFAQLVKDAPME